MIPKKGLSLREEKYESFFFRVVMSQKSVKRIIVTKERVYMSEKINFL